MIGPMVKNPKLGKRRGWRVGMILNLMMERKKQEMYIHSGYRWLKEVVVYLVYPCSFRDSNNDGGVT